MSYGEQLFSEASKASQCSIFRKLLAGGVDHDEVGEAFKKAGMQFKVENNWKRASECFKIAAEHYGLANDHYTQSTLLIESAEVEFKLGYKTIPKTLYQGCQMSILSDRASIAGRAWKAAADHFSQLGNEDCAIECYKQAAAAYELDKFAKTSYSICICAYAKVLAKKGQLAVARKVFENELQKATENENSSYMLKDLIMNAMILLLAEGDAVTTTERVKDLFSSYPSFTKTREANFLQNLAESFENNDTEQFSQLITDYDSLTPLDSWRMHFLAQAKQLLSQHDDEIIPNSINEEIDLS